MGEAPLRLPSGNSPRQVSGDGEGREVLVDVVLLQHINVIAHAVQRIPPGVLYSLHDENTRRNHQSNYVKELGAVLPPCA